MLPFRNQLGRVRRGDRIVVYVDLDRATSRPVATEKVERELGPPPGNLVEGAEAQLLIYERTDLGWKAIVDQSFRGLLYAEDAKAYAPRMRVGDIVDGFVQKIRSDGKVDVCLRPSGRKGVDHAREVVLAKLESLGGRISLHDRSEPSEISRRLGLSKKAFKRAVGGLYRERLIRITETGIEKIEPDQDPPASESEPSTAGFGPGSQD